jgi:hypothetical protein
MSASKVIANLKARANKFQKTNPVTSASEVIRQKKAKAIYSYANSIRTERTNQGTYDVFNRQSNGTCSITAVNGSTNGNLQNRNTNNVIQKRKNLVVDHVENSETNSLTDIASVKINDKVGQVLCCNNDTVLIRQLTEECPQLEYLTNMTKDASELRQRKITCCPVNYTRQQIPNDTSCSCSE